MTEEKRYGQISTESIQTWAEAVGVTDLSQETLRALAADVTYRLHQTLNICDQILQHSNRRRLSSDDFNRALKWMDVEPVYGYSGSESVDWVNVPELGVQVPYDPPVNLASTALSGDIFHQPGSSYVKAEWAHVSGHILMKNENNAEDKSLSVLPLSSELQQYYRTLFSVITNSSKKLFQIMIDDIGSNSNLGPLVCPIIGSVLKGAQKARQKPLILRRLLLVIRALLSNPHIHLGPQNNRELVNVLVFCIATERKNPRDTQCIRILASNILLKLLRLESRGGSSWELSAMSLSGVVASSTRPWTQHSGALMGLLSMGAKALHLALLPIAREYHRRLVQALANPPSVTSAIAAKDTLDAQMTHGLLLTGFVNMMFAFMKQIPNSYEVTVGPKAGLPGGREAPLSRDDLHNYKLIERVKEIYNLGAEMFGTPFIVQVPCVYLCWSHEAVERMKTDGYKMEDSSQENFRENGGIEPRTKRRKISAPNFSSLLSPRQIHGIDQWFESYQTAVPLCRRKIYVCGGPDWSARSFECLKRKKFPSIKLAPNPNRVLLLEHYKISKSSGKMSCFMLKKRKDQLCKSPMSLQFLLL